MSAHSCYPVKQLYYPHYLAQNLGLWVTCGVKMMASNAIVEGDSHLKLLPTTISDIYKTVEHIDMLTMGIYYQP